ncbi:MAG: 4'-phosphopantetheinyl transferase superfamily protein [Bacteroidetes bacterium]|nr:4'-phosphopantetheinyl transferase superfamily protein [Bacteroidota bacterium]
MIISNKNVGIDIQEYTPKIERIAAKFVNKEEWKMIRLDLQKEQLHLVWGAKESMYKLYGKRKVDFRGHMNISPFEFNNDGGIISGSLHKKEYQKNFNIHYKILEDYLLVFCADE